MCGLAFESVDFNSVAVIVTNKRGQWHTGSSNKSEKKQTNWLTDQKKKIINKKIEFGTIKMRDALNVDQQAEPVKENKKIIFEKRPRERKKILQFNDWLDRIVSKINKQNRRHQQEKMIAIQQKFEQIE